MQAIRIKTEYAEILLCLVIWLERIYFQDVTHLGKKKIVKICNLTFKIRQIYDYMQRNLQCSFFLMLLIIPGCMSTSTFSPWGMWWNGPTPPQSRTSADWWPTWRWGGWLWTPPGCQVFYLDQISCRQSPPAPGKSLSNVPHVAPEGGNKPVAWPLLNQAHFGCCYSRIIHTEGSRRWYFKEDS